MTRYLAYLREKGYTPGSVRQMYVSTKTLYSWLTNEVELLEKDPTRKIKRPKNPPYDPPTATRAELDQLLHTIPDIAWTDHRDKVIFQVMFFAGLRLSEVCRLTIHDVNFEERILKLSRKGGKLQRIPFAPDLVGPLWGWLYAQRPHTKHDALFLSSGNGGMIRGPLKPAGLQFMVLRRMDAAGMEHKSPHAWRHGFAKDMLKKGASTRLIQSLLGHAYLSTTELYLRLDTEDVMELAESVWNRRK
jgi:integrase/recombinase XerD